MKLFGVGIWLLSLILAATNVNGLTYQNFRLYVIKVNTEQQSDLLGEIENFGDGYQILSGSTKLSGEVQLVVPPQKILEFEQLARFLNMNVNLISNNLQEAIDRQSSSRRKAIFDWTSYWTLEEINEWMDSLVDEYPNIVSSFSIGKSHEGRDIHGVKVNFGGGEKKSIFFETLIHSYEWITPATTTWIINELLTSQDVEVRQLAERYEWHFLPVFNVDGYVYTWTTDRLWRKSRRPTKNPLCIGTDLNRNWDVHFGEGSSENPCHSRYGGDYVFSDVETKQLSVYLSQVPRLVGYFSLHALGQYLMFPYAYTTEKIESYDTLYEIGMKGSDALTAKHGFVYQFGPLNWFFDQLSGTSADWVALNLKPNVTFMYELRPTREEDRDDTGLLWPAEKIVEVAEEVFVSIVAILKAAIEKEFS